MVKDKTEQIAVSNRSAFHNYTIEERYEAGISLLGTEVKSIREGRVNLNDSFARVEDNEVFLYNCHISHYTHGNIMNHDPLRVKKLLLKREEIKRLIGKVQIKGLTLIPLKIYFKEGRAKVEIGIAKGKKLYDKRESLKDRERSREIDREFKERGR